MKTIQETKLKKPENTGKKQDTKFKKGQSGNPKGKPKGTFSLLTILKKQLQEIPPEYKGKERKQYAELLVKKQLHKAIVEGDDASIRLILNYIQGMPAQNVNLGNQDGKGLKIVFDNTFNDFASQTKGNNRKSGKI